MKRLIPRFLLHVASPSFASAAQAAGEWFVLFDANGAASSNASHPAAKKIAELTTESAELKSIAFACSMADG